MSATPTRAQKKIVRPTYHNYHTLVQLDQDIPVDRWQ